MMHKNKLCSADLCRLLNCSLPTLNDYMAVPGLIRLKDLVKLAGCFGINVETLVYCLNRTMEQIPVRKHGKPHLWYIEEKSLEGEKIVNSFNESLKG